MDDLAVKEMIGVRMRARARAALRVALSACCLGMFAFAATALAAHPARYARFLHACPPPRAHSASCLALLRAPVSAASASATAGVRPYVRAAGAVEAGPAEGLTPADLAHFYAYSPSGGGGQTVAIVDAYDDPKIEEDLASFDAHYGLGACTKADGCFRKVGQSGSETSLPAADTRGWSAEIALDVETVRAVCRGCRILLVEASSEKYKDLAAAENEAAALGANEISNSYGGPEVGMGVSERAAYQHPHVVVTASTGDLGWDDWEYLVEGAFPPAMPNAPASLSSVVAVGGTSVELNEDGTRAGESVWSEGGSGCSTLFAAQPWQRLAAGFGASGCGGARLTADVAADADPNTGFDVHDTYECGASAECKALANAMKEHEGWITFGGTSLSNPVIASLYALAGGANGLAYPSLTLYGRLGDAGSLYDVTQGGDGICGGEPASVCGHPNTEFEPGLELALDCEGTSACDARVGLDGPTGVGTPNGLGAFTPLPPTAAIAPPATIVAGEAAAFSSAASHDPYPGGEVTAWSWSFGDGTPVSTVRDPAHTYASSGEYVVKLSVTDSYSLTSATVEAPVHVISEAEGRRKHEEEEAAKHKHEEEEAARHKAEEEAHKREEEARRAKQAEEEAARGKHEEELATQHKHEEEATRKREEEERLRRQAEEAANLKGHQEVAPFIAAAPAHVRVLSSSLTVKKGVLVLKLACTSASGSCTGSVTLKALGRVAKRVPTLAAAPFTIAAGKALAVELHLSAAARRLLAKHHPLRVQLRLAGAIQASTSTVTLRLAAGGRR